MLLHHPFLSPALRSKPREEGDLRRPDFKVTAATRQENPSSAAVCSVHGGSYPCPIPALQPPEIQAIIPSTPRTERCELLFVFSYKTGTFPPANCMNHL